MPDATEAGSDVRARLAAQIAAIESGSHVAGATGGSAHAGAPSADQTLPDGGAAALAFLVRSTNQRPLTTGEAAAKLAAKGYDELIVQAVLDRAVAMRLLDDPGFARAWVEDRGINRGYGQQRLRRELRRRKIADADIDDALALLDDHDEVAQATRLARARAQRMPASLEPPKVAQRLVGFLVRRGFPGQVAHDVARRVTAMDRDWD